MLKANGINTILDIVNLRQAIVSTLMYKDGNKKIELVKGHQTLLIIAAHFNKFKRKNGASFQVVDWLKVDQDEFDNFRLDYDENDYLPFASAPTTPTTLSRTVPIIDPVREFKRGIKRDATLFPHLKNLKQWDTWYIETKAQARAQDVEDVFNVSYKASTPVDKAIFEQKQKFVYTIFTKTLLTDKGKSLVREHETNFNAQVIHKDLFEHAQ